MTRTDTKRRVATLLATSGPLSAGDITKLTGLSYNTVRNALEKIGAQSDGGFPAEYSYSGEIDTEKLLAQHPSLATGEEMLLIDLEQREKWVDDWNRSIPKLARHMEKLVLFPADDPKILKEQLRKIFTPMAGLAYQLQLHEDDPSWYSALGGDPEKKVS